MAISQLSRAIRDLRRLVAHQGDAELTDKQLLDRFTQHRDDSAFAALVHRHSRVVWGVCRRVVGHHHDAEDAFQATFLVLARKAPSIRTPALLGNWLYGVAYRTALKARTMAKRRQAKERQVSQMPEPATQTAAWHDLEPIIDQELAALPEKYRVALILCDLESKTGKEAARLLKIPEGTLFTRLRTARMTLAKRVASHGLTYSAGSLATILTHHAVSAGAPTSVLSSTIQAAPFCAAGHVATGLVSAKVTALMEGVLKAMLLIKLKIMMIVALVLGMGVVGGVFLPHITAAGQQAPVKQKIAPPRTAENPADPKKQAAPTERTTAQSKVTYSVAELVVPITGLDLHEEKTKEGWLIGKIVRSVSPNSWQANGGKGTIQYVAKSYSLIVTNSASVQAQVSRLLETMRRVQDVEVAAETKVVSLSDAGFRTIREFLPKLEKNGHTLLSDVEVFALIRKAEDHSDTHVLQAPKITFCPGQRAQFSTDTSGDGRGDKMVVKLTAHVAVNLQHIDLDVKARIGKTDFVVAERVMDGATVAQVKRDGNRYLVLLVTPRVILNIEEETVASPPESDSSQQKPVPGTR